MFFEALREWTEEDCNIGYVPYSLTTRDHVFKSAKAQIHKGI